MFGVLGLTLMLVPDPSAEISLPSIMGQLEEKLEQE